MKIYISNKIAGGELSGAVRLMVTSSGNELIDTNQGADFCVGVLNDPEFKGVKPSSQIIIKDGHKVDTVPAEATIVDSNNGCVMISGNPTLRTWLIAKKTEMEKQSAVAEA